MSHFGFRRDIFVSNGLLQEYDNNNNNVYTRQQALKLFLFNQENATFGSTESLEEFRLLSKTIPWAAVIR